MSTDNSNSKEKSLALVTKKLQGSFSQFHGSFNQTLQEIHQREALLLEQLTTLQDQKEELSVAYQQESSRGKQLHQLLQSTRDILNAASELEICNAVVVVLKEIYPQAVIKLLSTNDSDFPGTTAATACQKTACQTAVNNEQWRCTTAVKLWFNEQLTGVLVPKQNMCFHCATLSSKDYSSLYIPLFSDENVFWCIYIATKAGQPVLKKSDEDLVCLLITHVSLAVNKIRLMNTLKKESSTDPLTGLANRRAALKTLTQELTRATRYDNVFSIAMVDIDRFKVVNDTYGHDVGDQVLVLLADTTSLCFRNTDLVARFGGEEFLIIMPRTVATAAFQVIERFRAAFNKATLADTLKATNITVSAGIAEYPADSKDLDELLKVADTRLYQAKEAGRNQSVWQNEVLLPPVVNGQ